MMNTAGIRVEGLTKKFDSLSAVDHLTFSVRPGELFGLVGPDGAGKTTILRMLAGVMRPTAGEIFLGELSVVRDPERVKPEIAYMSQRFGLYADLTVLENLHFYADLFQVPAKEREARLDRLFHFSNLRPFKDSLAGKLSGGMKQKLGLSCALIHQPKILFLDEPTFGVDPISRRDLWLIVHGMVAQGVTAVISTAYMDEAERFDRVAFLQEGRLLAIDTPEALQKRLEGEMIMIKVEKLREARASAAVFPGIRRAAIFGDRLHITLDSVDRDLPALETFLLEQGFPVLERQKITPTMEDVFIDHIKKREPA